MIKSVLDRFHKPKRSVPTSLTVKALPERASFNRAVSTAAGWSLSPTTLVAVGREPGLMPAAASACVQIEASTHTPATSAGRTAASHAMAMSPTRLAKPDLGSRYSVVELIGEGGMGTVWKVMDLITGRILAAKTVRGQLSHEKVWRSRLEREARTATGLTQRNIGAVYGLGKAPDGTNYLLMQYVPGESLATLLETGKLGITRIFKIVVQICDALTYVHSKGIIHRDVTPGNVLVSTDSEGMDCAYLVDFGIAKPMPKPGPTDATTENNRILGTPHYMSPEHWQGCEGVQTDIYSLGCLLYEAMTGAPPFDDDNPLKLMLSHMNDTPRSITSGCGGPVVRDCEAIVMKCLAKDRTKRYQSAEELKQEILTKILNQPHCVSGRPGRVSALMRLVASTDCAQLRRSSGTLSA